MSATSVAASAVKRLSRVTDRLVPAKPGITVLIYHRVGGGTESQVDLDPAVFDDQLAALTASHRVVALADALVELSGLDESEPIIPGVVITFDDGTADFTDVVVPILVRQRVPATLYVATEFVETGTDFPWGAPPCSWEGLRESVSTGLVSVGSHTHAHRLLDRLPAGEVADELDRSIDLIGTELGIAPLDFAYPKAVLGSTTAEIEVRRRFRSAAVAGNRRNRAGRTDVHRLARTPVQRNDTPEIFDAKASGGLRLEGDVRAIASRFRYRSDVR